MRQSNFTVGFEKIALKIGTYVRALENRQNRVKEFLAKKTPQEIQASQKLRMADRMVSNDVPHQQVRKLVDQGISPEAPTKGGNWRVRETAQRTLRGHTSPSQFNTRTRLPDPAKQVVPAQWKDIYNRGMNKVSWELNPQSTKDFSRGASRGYGMQDFKSGLQNIKNQLGFGGSGPGMNNLAAGSRAQMSAGTVQRSERPGT